MIKEKKSACEDALDKAKELIGDTEIQIDFMDFLASIRVQDKITLMNSFADDFSSAILDGAAAFSRNGAIFSDSSLT